MKCANCGAELKLGCVYCSVCGKEAQIVPDYNELDDDYLKALLEEENDTGAVKSAQSSDNRKAPEKKKKKSKKKTGVIIGVIVSLLLAALLSIFGVLYLGQKNSFSYQYEKAIYYSDQSNYTKALSYLERALELEPDQPDALYELARIYEKREDYEEAEVALLKITATDPSNKKAYQLLIDVYEKQKDYDAIVTLYESVEDDSVRELFTEYLLEKPVMTPQGGKYEEATEVSVSAPRGATIYYTMDGSDPVEHGVPYTDSIHLEEEGNYTIKAVACDERGIYSEVEKEKYVIEFAAPEMATVTPSAGTYTEAVSVTIHVPEGAKAYYTWDGTNPTTGSEQYSQPLELPEGNNILSILVVSEQGLSSPVAKYNYIYQP